MFSAAKKKETKNRQTIYVNSLQLQKSLKLTDNSCTSTRETLPANEGPSSNSSVCCYSNHSAPACPCITLPLLHFHLSVLKMPKMECLWNWYGGFSEQNVHSVMQVLTQVQQHLVLPLAEVQSSGNSLQMSLSMSYHQVRSPAAAMDTWELAYKKLRHLSLLCTI